jgi:excisionase family DNA binding protein
MPKRPTADPSPDFLTTEEVMERLLADDSLRRSAARCVLPAIRCGNEWRFRKRDLDAWIERHRSGVPPLPSA